MVMGLITTMTLIGTTLIVFSYYYNSFVTDIISKILVGPSIAIMFMINIYAWVGNKVEYMTFTKMVRNSLDEYFHKVNAYYA